MAISNNLGTSPTPSPTVEHAFGVFDGELSLDPDERARAQEFHHELTSRLKEADVIVDAFLQGSFARKTMLKPLRDIDKVVILHPQHGDLQIAPDGAVKAAQLVEGVLTYEYPDAAIERARHAIQLDLGEDTFGFDVVPAFEGRDESDDVMIMDLAPEKYPWKRSNTRRLIDVVAERNDKCNGSFVHQVRFMKHWAQRTLDESLPGLHVESIAFLAIEGEMPHAIAVARIFRVGAQLLGGVGYTDPTGVDRLSGKLDQVSREAARQAFAEADAKANQALLLDSNGRTEEALALWYEIFDEPFPRRQLTGEEYLTNLSLGAPVSTGIRPKKPQTTPTRPWAP